MDQPALSVKARIEKEVLGTIIDGLNSGELTAENAQVVAKDTLAALQKIDKHEESILKFYKDLSDKHPLFKILYTRINAEVVKARELSAHRNALVALDIGNIDEAKKIATGAMEATAHEATINN